MQRNHLLVAFSLTLLAIVYLNLATASSGYDRVSGTPFDAFVAALGVEPESAEEPVSTETSLDPVELEENEPAFAQRIPADERAYVLEFDTRGAFYQRLEAGDRVDIIGLFDREQVSGRLIENVGLRFEADEKPDAAPLVTTLLQNVTILGVHAHPERPADGARVSVSAPEFAVSSLQLADAAGELRLLVRHPEDAAFDPIQRYTLRSALAELEVVAKLRRDRRSKQAKQAEKPSVGARFADNIPAESRGAYVAAPHPASTLDRGDVVDISVIVEFDRHTSEPAGKERGLVHVELLQAVEVLDVVSAEGQGAPIQGVILATSVAEAQILNLAEHHGELEWTIRNPENLEVGAINRITLRRALEDLEVLRKRTIEHQQPRRYRRDKRGECDMPDPRLR